MADEARNKSTGSAPPSAPPPIVTQTRAREGRPWLALLIYLIIALAVAAVIVLGGRWVYHALRDEEPARETATSTNKAPEPPAATDNKKSRSSSGQPSTSGSQARNNENNEARELADTGPGQVAALFVTVTLAAAGLHYVYQLRRAD